MKTLTALFVVALTMVATTSHAEKFCLKKYADSLNRNSTKTNYYPGIKKSPVPAGESRSQAVDAGS